MIKVESIYRLYSIHYDVRVPQKKVPIILKANKIYKALGHHNSLYYIALADFVLYLTRLKTKIYHKNTLFKDAFKNPRKYCLKQHREGGEGNLSHVTYDMFLSK